MRQSQPAQIHSYKNPFNRSVKQVQTGMHILNAYGQYNDFVKESKQYIKDTNIQAVRVPKMNSFNGMRQMSKKV